MSKQFKIRLAIADDHQIVIDGLAAALNNFPQFEIVITANSGVDILEQFKTKTADILLTDVMMPGMSGQQLAGAVRANYPSVGIIALSMSGNGHIVDEMIKAADINAYLLKQCGINELVNAIETVFDGGQHFDPQVLEDLARHGKIQDEVKSVHLTLREKEIIALMEKDLSNKEMSSQLSISIRTVETHRKNIFRKTGTNNLLSLVKWAYEHSILTSE
ncbi:MAG: response regulator transcription factor [Ferruginibacter sp.]